MTDDKLKLFIREAVALDRLIRNKTAELAEIKDRLIREGELREDERTPTEGGGSSWTGAGADGCVARVTVPAPKLVSTISAESAKIAKLRELAGKWYDSLFEQKPAYKPIFMFRDAVRDALIPLANKGKIIKLCESQSAPSVSFETKDAPA